MLVFSSREWLVNMTDCDKSNPKFNFQVDQGPIFPPSCVAKIASVPKKGVQYEDLHLLAGCKYELKTKSKAV